MDLEPPTGIEPSADPRPRMPEPPPVRLVSVDDVRLLAPAGVERELDSFYVGLLGFEREDVELPRPRPRIEPLLGGARQGATPPPLALGIRNREQASRAAVLSETLFDGREPPGPIYRAENFRLRFQLAEGLIVRESLRAQGIEIPSLAAAEAKLIDAEIEYVRQRGLMPGQESLALLDPAGNWLELVETKPV